MTRARIAGADLSLTSTGIAYNTGWCGTVGLSGITKMPLRQRIAAVGELADTILIRLHGMDLVAVEKLVFARGVGGAGGAGERAHLYYLVVGGLIGAGIPVVEVPQATLKTYALGTGKGDKHQVIDAVARRLPMFATKGNDDMCDAAVLAAMAADHLGHPLTVMPASHRAALGKVAWPAAAAA